LEQKDKVLEAKEAELQGKEAAVTMLTETLMKKMSSSRHERWPFGTQRPPSKRRKPPCPCSRSRRTLRRHCWSGRKSVPRVSARGMICLS
jgi:hypothetical protein